MGTSSSIILTDFNLSMLNKPRQLALRTQMPFCLITTVFKAPSNQNLIGIVHEIRKGNVTKHNFWTRNPEQSEILKAHQVNDLSANDVYIVRIKPLLYGIQQFLFFSLA